MNRVHTEVMAALLPWCKSQTASVRNAAPAAGSVSASGVSSNIVAKLVEHLNNCEYSEEAKEALRGTAILLGGASSSYGLNVTAAIDRFESEGDEDTSATGANYPVGSVVVVVGGTRVNKRVMGRAYIITEAGTSPTPLGIRGLGEEGRRAFAPEDIRPATDAEIADGLTKLSAAQVQAIICDLAASQPWKQVLAGVVENNRSFCRTGRDT